jgi:hypothetical protein
LAGCDATIPLGCANPLRTNPEKAALECVGSFASTVCGRRQFFSVCGSSRHRLIALKLGNPAFEGLAAEGNALSQTAKGNGMTLTDSAAIASQLIQVLRFKAEKFGGLR